MHDSRTHPLLEQVPLTVSPFVNLPTATTLPYTYKAMPSTLPPSSTGITAAGDNTGAAGPSSADGTGASSSSVAASNKPKYVISSSGHAAHPDDIIASCRALQAHISKLQADADAELRALDERIRARELAEKRRVAPGWLDSEARMLEPERKGNGTGAGPGVEEMAEVSVGMTQQFAHLSIGGMPGGQSGQYQYQGGHGPGGASEMAVPDEGEELDRAFGGLGLNQR